MTDTKKIKYILWALKKYLSSSLLWQDPFGEKRGMFDFVAIQQRLEVIKKKLDDKKPVGHASDGSSSDNENVEES